MTSAISWSVKTSAKAGISPLSLPFWMTEKISSSPSSARAWGRFSRAEPLVASLPWHDAHCAV